MGAEALVAFLGGLQILLAAVGMPHLHEMASSNDAALVYAFRHYEGVKKVLQEARRRFGWETLHPASLIPERTLVALRYVFFVLVEKTREPHVTTPT